MDPRSLSERMWQLTLRRLHIRDIPPTVATPDEITAFLIGYEQAMDDVRSLLAEIPTELRG